MNLIKSTKFVIFSIFYLLISIINIIALSLNIKSLINLPVLLGFIVLTPSIILFYSMVQLIYIYQINYKTREGGNITRKNIIILLSSLILILYLIIWRIIFFSSSTTEIMTINTITSIIFCVIHLIVICYTLYIYDPNKEDIYFRICSLLY